MSVYSDLYTEAFSLVIGKSDHYTTVGGESITLLSTRFYRTPNLANSLVAYNHLDPRKAASLPANLTIIVPHGASEGTADERLMDGTYQFIPPLLIFVRDSLALASTYSREGLDVISRILSSTAKSMDYLFDTTTQGGLLIPDWVVRMKRIATLLRKAAAWFRVNVPYGAVGGAYPTISDVATTAITRLQNWRAWRDLPTFNPIFVALQLAQGVSP